MEDRFRPEKRPDDAGVLAALAALNDDHTLGRYELLTPVGRGGMAVVWAARQRGTRGFAKMVAVKTMLPMMSSDPRFERMFLEEAELASKIDHPNVCRVLDLGEDRGVLYLVMEWVDGEPLTTLSRLCAAEDRDLPHGVAAWVAAKAARGLAAAHDLRTDTGEPFAVLHRDVSPQNILVTARGLVKVVDFGVAKAVARTERATESGYIKGKVAYLAPEQVHGRDFDARADVFALGTVLFELACGRHPFAAETDLGTLLALSSPDPIAVPAELPPELRRILERALAKDKSDRHPTMRELAAELEAFAGAARVNEDAAAAFLGEVLEPRRAARAAELRAAEAEADARSARATPHEAPPRESEPSRVTPAAAIAPPRTARSGSRSLALAAVASMVGVVVGLSLSRTTSTSRAAVEEARPAASTPAARDPAPAPPSDSGATTPASASPAPPPSAAVRRENVPRPRPLASAPPASVASTSASAPPRASSSAAPAPSGAPVVLRRPGF